MTSLLVGVMRLLDTSKNWMGSRTSTEEASPMSEASGTPSGFKTIGVKLPDELHAQLVLIANLDGVSLTDAIRAAIDGFIAVKREEGDLAARAAQALEDIEREAAARRGALEALFGPHVQAAREATGTAKRRGRETTQ